MLECFLGSKSHIRGSFKKLADQIFCIIWYSCPNFAFHRISSIEDVINDILVLSSSKRWFTAKHDVHYDSHRPHIALSCVWTFEHLRSNIVRSSIRFVHYFVWDNSFCKSEINQFNVRRVIFLIEQKVLWLDVSMTNSILMKIAQCVKRLFHDTARLILGEMLFLSNMIE